MIKKIPSLFLLIFVFIISSCEDYYNFEAKKLDTKASKLIEEANTSAFKIDEKMLVAAGASEEQIRLFQASEFDHSMAMFSALREKKK